MDLLNSTQQLSIILLLFSVYVMILHFLLELEKHFSSLISLKHSRPFVLRDDRFFGNMYSCIFHALVLSRSEVLSLRVGCLSICSWLASMDIYIIWSVILASKTYVNVQYIRLWEVWLWWMRSEWNFSPATFQYCFYNFSFLTKSSNQSHLTLF